MHDSSIETPTGDARDEHAPEPGEQAAPRFRITAGYLAVVALIFVITSAAWLFLGQVTDQRTKARDYSLRRQVGQIWGGVHQQIAPSLQSAAAVAQQQRAAAAPTATAAAPGKAPEVKPAVASSAAVSDPRCAEKLTLSPLSTRAEAKLALEHRRKGLLWYNTYAVRFSGHYTFKNPTPCAKEFLLSVPLPARQAAYDDFVVEVDGKPQSVAFVEQPLRAATLTLELDAGASRKIAVRYASRGLDQWSYLFGRSTARAPDFDLKVQTNFDKVDFPEGTLSPTRKSALPGGGWQLTWHFGNLLSDSSIAIAMPRKINPGPLASEISRFAPVSLLFFFGVLLLVAVLRQVRLHPMHFAMLAGAFFAFHLLFAYLVDHVPLWVALSAASATSVGLVVSYLRLALGTRFALLWAGGAQLLYLVLFSLAFCWEGYTGLTITIFSILTLFVAMQLTARIDWFAAFGRSKESTAAAPIAMEVQDAFQRVR